MPGIELKDYRDGVAYGSRMPDAGLLEWRRAVVVSDCPEIDRHVVEPLKRLKLEFLAGDQSRAGPDFRPSSSSGIAT